VPDNPDDLGAALAAPAGSIAAVMAEAFPPLAVTDALAKITADIRADLTGVTKALETLAPIAEALSHRETLAPLADLVEAHREGLAEVAAEVADTWDALTVAYGTPTDPDALAATQAQAADLERRLADDIAQALCLARIARIALTTPGAEALPTETAAEHTPGDPWNVCHYPVSIICREAPRLARQRRARTRRTVTTARQLRRRITRRHDTPRPVPASPVAARPRRYCRRTYAGARRSDDPSPTRSAESPNGGFMSGRSAFTLGEGAPTDR
jgi:NTP pyrophosphatase (non-canonical NTP hydrolase)